MSKWASVRSRRSSPDPRIGPTRARRPRLLEKLRDEKKKNSKSKILQKITETVEMSKVENIVYANTSESEDKSLCEWQEDRPFFPDYGLCAKKVQKSKNTASLINSDTTSGLNVSPVLLDSSCDESDFLDSSDAESYCSTPEKVRGFDTFGKSECEYTADMTDQTRWHNKNSTLLEISKAVPIDEMFDPADIFVISPITKESCLDPSRSHQTQWQYSPNQCAASSLVSGKPIYKIRNGKNTTINEKSFPLPYETLEIKKRTCKEDQMERSRKKVVFSIEPPTVFPPSNKRTCKEDQMERSRKRITFSTEPPTVFPPSNSLQTFMPEEKERAKKIVTFGSPLATVIPRTDLADEDESFCSQIYDTMPTKAELSVLFKKLSENTNEMFIHHPVVRLLAKSQKQNFCKVKHSITLSRIMRNFARQD
ncbi:uncharacterized protein LOC142150157 isoform X2 [Mixophyes fleayi]|uniref:uncharacterized protein LOC142150157 isoform X2 n=1 Tax=Mixophyes fleayi TaxID=3061075 RepID=UPI003F4D79AC